MMNRNLRYFENIKTDNKASTNRGLINWDKDNNDQNLG